MPGSPLRLGLVPQGLALVCAVVVVLVPAVALLGGRRRPVAPPGPSFELEGASVHDETAALRQALADVRRRLEGTERLLVAIPECTKDRAQGGQRA